MGGSQISGSPFLLYITPGTPSARETLVLGPGAGGGRAGRAGLLLGGGAGRAGNSGTGATDVVSVIITNVGGVSPWVCPRPW